MNFVWDPKKATANRKKHGVSFTEAATVFGDPLALTLPDTDHSLHESRYLTVGVSQAGQVRIVSHTDRGDELRKEVL